MGLRLPMDLMILELDLMAGRGIGMDSLGLLSFRSIFKIPCSIIRGSLISGTMPLLLVLMASSSSIGMKKDTSGHHPPSLI